MRPLDHLVLPVTTLTLARSRLTSLGFTVAPDARHPFGTGNCCVFFQNRTYLEPVTIVDRGAADVAAAEGVVFVRRVKRFTERQGEGLAMVALKSADAEADAADFRLLGVGGGPPQRFSRMASLPDGSQKEVGFATAFADQPAAADAAFFAIQHLDPDVLYQPDYLDHANGALGVSGLAAIAENPADFHILLSGATGQRELHATSNGVEADLGGQRIAVLTPAAFRARYGINAVEPRRGLLFAAIDITVASPERASRFAGSAAIRHEGRIVIPPAPGLGAVLAMGAEENG